MKDGRPIRVVGDRRAPLYGGYTCPKGRALPEQHTHPQRLLSSQRRGADGFEAIDSERAMDEVAARVRAIIEESGPRSVALYIGTNALPYPGSVALGPAWLRALGSRMLFTSNTIDQPGKQIALALHGGWHAGAQDFESADTWLIVGQNPLISKSASVPSQNPGQKLKAAVGRGMELVVIDPRRTETARRAHVHLQPRPGEDPALLAAMLHVIFHEGMADHAFLAANARGVEELREAVAPFTPEHVAERAGVPKADLIEAARVFGSAQRGGASCGTGSSFATRGTLTEYLALCLSTVCGYWPRAGEQATRLNVLLPAFTPRAEPYPPYRAWGFGEKLRARGLTNTAAGLPTAALNDEILLPGEGRVRALFCLGGNPMMAFPDQRRTQQAMQKLDLLVTFDPELSATSRLADYVIAPKLTLETPGMSQPAELLKYFGPAVGYAKPFGMYAAPAVEAPEGADVVEEWQFFYGLAQRMDLPIHVVGFYGWGKHVESPVVVTELDMRRRPSTEELYEIICKGSRVPLAEVKKHPHGALFDEVRDVVHPRDDDCGARLECAEPSMLSELALVRADEWRARQNTPKHPFRLVPRRSNHFVNSSGRSLQGLTRGRPWNPAYLHPEDLVELELSPGDLVRIRSRHDAVLGVVAADESLRRGLVSMTHAFGTNPDEQENPRAVGSNTGRLLRAEDDYDPVSGIPRMGALPVAVESVR